MFHNVSQKAQSGQAIVLMALVMVGLLAMLGLGIDGGRLFFLYRDMQNAADAAAWATVLRVCVSNNVDLGTQEGYSLAELNGYSNGVISDSPHQENIVDITITPNSNPFEFMYQVDVTIRGIRPTVFMGIIGIDTMEATALAATQCRQEVKTDNLVIVATNSESENPIRIGASNSTIIGDTYSANNTQISGSYSSVTGYTLSAGEAQFSPGVTATGTYDNVLVTIEPPWSWPDFEPGGYAYEQAAAAGKLYIHSSRWQRNNSPDQPPIESGLHVVYGDVILLDLTSADVSGPFTVAATGSVSMSGSDLIMDAYTTDPARGALLIYSDKAETNTGANAITLNSSNASWNGDIVAGRSGGINSSHAESTSFGKIWGGTVTLDGSNITITGSNPYEAIERQIYMVE